VFILVLASSERFGLSQLHQLRGRVGRGASQSYCILMSSEKRSEEARTRINTMVQTQDGFELAEVDLRLRGPGNLMGTQQSGLLQLKIANVIKDTQLLQTARAYAQDIIKKDPNLETEEHQNIKYTLAQIQFHQNIWNFIS
jgi:ATP-dependent DNA helicase RecG